LNLNGVRNSFYQKTKDFQHTIFLIKSDFNKIFGGYSPDNWRDTNKQWVDIKNGKICLFYFYEN